MPGVRIDIRERAVDALALAARNAEEVESWVVSGRHHDRTLGLLTSDPCEQRWTALLGRARSHLAQRAVADGRDDALVVLEEAERGQQNVKFKAAALTMLGELYAASGDYDEAERTLSQAVQEWRAAEDASGVANALRELGMSHLFRGELNEADALISEALAAYRNEGNRRGEAWALQNVAWISFSRGDASTAERRLQESAELFGELGDWGGLGWAFGLLAFVRYMQGRLDEAAELAEQIAVEGLETGNRWAVGMMDVLLADVALWRGRTREAVNEGRNAVKLFQDIEDGWGEIQASAPVVRALAELGEREESEIALARMRAVAANLPSAGMQHVPEIVQANIFLQYGDPQAAARLLSPRDPELQEIGNSDHNAAYGLLLLQLGRVDDAIALLEPQYANAEYDGAAMNMGSRLALAYAAAHRPVDCAARHRRAPRARRRYLSRPAARALGRGRRQHADRRRSPRRGRRRARDRHEHRRAARTRHRRPRRAPTCSTRSTIPTPPSSAPTPTVSWKRSASPARAGRRSSTSRGRKRSGAHSQMRSG